MGRYAALRAAKGAGLKACGVAFDDAFGDCVAGEPGDVVNAELIHDLLAVFLDGFDADTKFGGDCLLARPSAMSCSTSASRVVR